MIFSGINEHQSVIALLNGFSKNLSLERMSCHISRVINFSKLNI